MRPGIAWRKPRRSSNTASTEPSGGLERKRKRTTWVSIEVSMQDLDPAEPAVRGSTAMVGTPVVHAVAYKKLEASFHAHRL